MHGLRAPQQHNYDRDRGRTHTELKHSDGELTTKVTNSEQDPSFKIVAPDKDKIKKHLMSFVEDDDDMFNAMH